MKLTHAALIALAAALIVAGCGDEDDGTTGAEPGAEPADGGPPAAETGGQEGGSVKLRIEEFKDGGEIPVDITCDGPGGPPLVTIRAVPAKARELALLVTDPDAPGGTYFHWGVAGIDPSTASFGNTGAPSGAVETANDSGAVGYAPPCPPPGDGPHSYVFTLHALRSPSGLEEGAEPDAATEAVESASIAADTVTGTFER